MATKVLKQHLANAADAKRGTLAPGLDRHTIARMDIKLKQLPTGKWQLFINGGSPMPATDVEVNLWLEIQTLKTRLATSQPQTAA